MDKEPFNSIGSNQLVMHLNLIKGVPICPSTSFFYATFKCGKEQNNGGEIAEKNCFDFH